METERTLATADEMQASLAKKGEIATAPLSVQDEMTKLIPLAGTIVSTEEQRRILFGEVRDEDVEIRPDGLVYLPWMSYVTRLRDAFGTSWALVPKEMPKMQDNYLFWPFYLMVQGKVAGFAIGEQQYHPSNATMTYGDAAEGAKSNALMRLCKGLGISLELWKPAFIRRWKEQYAETYFDKEKSKTLWRRKSGGQKKPESTPGESAKAPDGQAAAGPPTITTVKTKAGIVNICDLEESQLEWFATKYKYEPARLACAAEQERRKAKAAPPSESKAEPPAPIPDNAIPEAERGTVAGMVADINGCVSLPILGGWMDRHIGEIGILSSSAQSAVHDAIRNAQEKLKPKGQGKLV